MQNSGKQCNLQLSVWQINHNEPIILHLRVNEHLPMRTYEQFTYPTHKQNEIYLGYSHEEVNLAQIPPVKKVKLIFLIATQENKNVWLDRIQQFCKS